MEIRCLESEYFVVLGRHTLRQRALIIIAMAVSILCGELPTQACERARADLLMSQSRCT